MILRFDFCISLCSIYTGYGLSEITLVGISKPSPGVPGSAGILLPGVEARILREDGTETGSHEPGELWLRSGGVALGYQNNEEATRETFVDGWLKTGDRFSVDENGTFFFQDRIKVGVIRGFYRCPETRLG
jgi:long-subunit acyl-CoA synthetase (AMP-forming)